MKAQKTKQIYKQTYKKGVVYNNKQKLIEFLKQPGTTVTLQSAGHMDNETEFLQITIEGIKI